MHSPALALTWQMWRRHRLGLAIVFALVLADVIIAQTQPAGSFEKSHAYLLTMHFFFAVFYLIAVFAYSFECALESGESGFPSRQFTLPVRTAQLIFWPMLMGVGTIVVLWTVWICFVLRRAGIEVSLGQSVLQVAAIALVLQALLWWPFGVPWVRIICALVFLPLLALAPILAAILEIADEWLTLFFAVLIPCAYFAALVGVARTRRGDTPVWRSPFASARASVHHAEREDYIARPFRSSASALGWFERRRYLLSFPLAVGCAAMLHVMMIFWLEEVAENKLKLAINFLAIPPLLAPILGSLLGRTGSNPKTALIMSTFIATRPVTTFTLVAAKWKATALLVVAAWGALLLVASLCFFGTDMHRQASAGWQSIRAGTPLWKIGAAGLLIVATLFLVTCRLMTDSLCVALTGRRWIAHANLFLHGLALTVGMMIGADALSRYSTMQAVRDALPWLAGAAVAMKLVLAAMAIRELSRRGLVETRTLSKLVSVWVAITVALFLLAWSVLPEGIVSFWLLACGVVLVMPLARLAATPLALAWNRHR